MKFTAKALDNINAALDAKKRENPIDHHEIGIGVNIKNDMIMGATAFKNNWAVCTVDELSRMIEELTMLRDAIEEETGVML